LTTQAAGIGVTVINTLKFKIVKKTDKHDAATIAEFPKKDMLAEPHLCTRESEQMRRLLKVLTTLVRAEVVVRYTETELREKLKSRKISTEEFTVKRRKECELYTLIETAKANERNPAKYPTGVFRKAAGMDSCDDWSQLLPRNLVLNSLGVVKIDEY
jgi:hypothetical protein